MFLRFKLLAFLCLLCLLLTFIGTPVIGAPVANAGQSIVNHQNDVTMPTIPAKNMVNAPFNNNDFITIAGADSVYPEITSYATASAVFNEVSNNPYMAAGISSDSGFCSFIVENLYNIASNPATNNSVQVTPSLKLPIAVSNHLNDQTSWSG